MKRFILFLSVLFILSTSFYGCSRKSGCHTTVDKSGNISISDKKKKNKQLEKFPKKMTKKGR